MERDPNVARVLAVGSVQPATQDVIVTGGQTYEIGQSHLLEPFVGLLGSLERLASAIPCGAANNPNEEACVRAAYNSLYCFFETLLPSACHETIDGLTYSVCLLLVGEAIEASRVVVPLPVSAASGESQKAGSQLRPSSFPPARFVQ